MSTQQAWRKSSYSGNENNCVELVVRSADTSIRDSKQPAAGTLTFGREPFAVFLASIKAGDLHQY
ncbi:DUF397 domain-containing protein [Solihabitans fulvus]|uniref:DUF397 domain-containing protein n=1 Tax=Solihabitans fulvus TaxID=1892852 RepID=A0A5B2X7F0_9PSEU|nr:DUF397 domain-containing protein [Solihabitans fulvus]KAA2258812.1 DUF397 domain-containing protein [Solihabitans fulvus]